MLLQDLRIFVIYKLCQKHHLSSSLLLFALPMKETVLLPYQCTIILFYLILYDMYNFTLIDLESYNQLREEDLLCGISVGRGRMAEGDDPPL